MRIPAATDAPRLHRLVHQSPPLDMNSVYCNLLQCTHFSQTAIAAECDGELVGFVSGYIIPSRQDTLFIWQVAIRTSARGQGLATRMLSAILARPVCAEIRWLETTVTESNTASRALFEGLAKKHATQLNAEILFDKIQHFAGDHESEWLLRIGPIPSQLAGSSYLLSARQTSAKAN
ncbi:MAG: diaminobutyrate acetyltransferase [Pseudohongiellaceae bacterium]